MFVTQRRACAPQHCPREDTTEPTPLPLQPGHSQAECSTPPPPAEITALYIRGCWILVSTRHLLAERAARVPECSAQQNGAVASSRTQLPSRGLVPGLGSSTRSSGFGNASRRGQAKGLEPWASPCATPPRGWGQAVLAALRHLRLGPVHGQGRSARRRDPARGLRGPILPSTALLSPAPSIHALLSRSGASSSLHWSIC